MYYCLLYYENDYLYRLTLIKYIATITLRDHMVSYCEVMLMKETFFRLSEQKQQNLLDASIKEFSQYSYESASINRIIAIANISKGGLFKYIENKRDLYLYTIEQVLTEVVEYQCEMIDYSSSCYFERLKSLIRSGFEFYKKDTDKYKMEFLAYTDFSSPCYNDVIQIRQDLIMRYQSRMLENIEWDKYIYTKDEILKVSEYMIGGYNIRFASNMKEINNITELEKRTFMELELIFKVIKTGVMKGVEND